MTKPATQYDPPPGIVALGTRVEVELGTVDGDVERLTFDIVPDAAADFAGGFLAASTPLARAIMGRPSGATVPYAAGDIVRATILAVHPSDRPADADASVARDAATRAAVERARTEDTIRLALTFSSKWGDYDPTPLEPNARDTDEPDHDPIG
ncbi:MAG: hypothetical protein BWY52_01908 [Chloroflexi bacterium ADurb.Bin325]|nr:MAG: hypothetical protein BWY52_01908 [Chloroflexi bacterium ADurb.Bin325]